MPKRDPDHHHHYVVVNQDTKPAGPQPKGTRMTTYTFYKCDAAGQCDRRDKMEIRRWKSK